MLFELSGMSNLITHITKQELKITLFMFCYQSRMCPGIVLSSYWLVQLHTAAVHRGQRTHCCGSQSPSHLHRSCGPADAPHPDDPADRLWPAGSSPDLSSDSHLIGGQQEIL